MRARPYQDQCVGRVFEVLGVHRSALVVMATGLGKTVVFSHVAGRWPSGRVLVLVHREELAAQAGQKLEAVTGEAPSLEMGDSRDRPTFAGRSKVVVASVQTLSRPERLARFDPAAFGLVIIDEAHHAVASSYREVVRHFQANPDSRLLGVTATPRRADELAMGQVFECVAFDYGIEPAIADGWLVPVRQQVVKVEGLDFSDVRKTAGDLNGADLERVLTAEGPLHRMAVPTVELAGDRPALVFCVNVEHAKLMSAVIDRYKQGASAWLSGQTDPEVRRRTVEAYRKGDLQFLCNCNLFLEGFDAPATALVVMARPTLSLALYTQVLGRGTRPLPGVVDGLDDPAARRAAVAASGKPWMTVLDFVGNSGRHKIVQAADVLGGKWGTPVRCRAKELAAEDADEGRPAAAVEELLDRADAELAFLAEEEELERRRHIKARAEYRTQEVSPFGGAGAAVMAAAPARPQEPATEKQRRYLVRLGVPWEESADWTKRRAGAEIDWRLKRQQQRAGA